MPNDDYIKRSDAVSAFCGNCEGTEVCGQLGEPCDEVKRIRAIPAADVAPVVRCKDCKYKPTAPDGITHGLQVEFPDKWANRCPCLCEDGWYSWVPDDNFFCAYGAREEDDGTV